MRFKRLIIGLIIPAIGMFFLVSCLNEDNKIPPNCFDGELNNGEEAVDCGGPCEECPPTCFNGEWDVYPDDYGGWVEEDVDCGGSCEPCPTCDDGILNQGELGIDCGGIDEDGFPICDDCPTPDVNCVNDTLDGDEIGVDCGGCCCPDCPEEVVDCTDGIINGDEEWFDCGGCCCPDCPEPMVVFVVTEIDGETQVPPANIELYFGEVLFDVNQDILSATADGYLPVPDPSIEWNTNAPLGGWSAGQTEQIFNEDTQDLRVLTITIDGTIYTTADEDADNGVTMRFNVIDDVFNPPGTFIEGIFFGELNVVGPLDEDLKINNGTFRMQVQ